MSRPVTRRSRPFMIRNHELPEAVHMVQEFVHDICLELGVSLQCRLKLLHRAPVNGKVRIYKKCFECLQYSRAYYHASLPKGKRKLAA